MSQARLSITPADAWSDQRLTPLQCRLLGLIGSYLGKDHRAWPSQSTLAAQLGVSRKAVNEGIRALVSYGYIKAERRRRDDGGETSSVYFVVMDPVERVGMEGYTPCNSTVTPLTPQRDTPCNFMEVTPPVTLRGYTNDTIERPNEVHAVQVLENIWQAWSPEGRKRSKAKAKIEVQLTALAKHHPLQAIERAAIAFARDAKPEFHPALDRWLKDGKFENWQEAAPTVQTDLTNDEWANAMRHWVGTDEWLAGHVCPAPDQSGCTAPEAMLRHAARLRPELAENINRNIEQRKVA